MSRLSIAVKTGVVALLMFVSACDKQESPPTPSAEPKSVAPPDPPPSTQPTSAKLNPIIGAITADNMLPNPFDRNMVQGSFTYAGANNDELLSGDSFVKKFFERIDKKVKTDRLFQPKGAAILRAEFDPAKTMNLLGSSVAGNASKQIIALVDDAGKQYLPIGFAWAMANDEFTIRIDRNALIATGFDIPFRKVGANEHIFVYWQVPSGTKIKRVKVGQTPWFEAEITAP